MLAPSAGAVLCRSWGGKSRVSSSLASGSLGWRFGGQALAPPKMFNLPLLWLHRNGTDCLPAAWAGAGGSVTGCWALLPSRDAKPGGTRGSLVLHIWLAAC